METVEAMTWLVTSPWWAGGIALWVVCWVGLEGLWYWRGGRSVDVGETATSLASFAVVGVAQVGLSLLFVPLLAFVWPHRLFTMPMDQVWPWLVAWVVTDFVYYWIHRMLHVTRLGWGFHAPHHSIRQITLLDSLRTSWAEQPVGVFAYGIPLVLLGIPPHIAGVFYVFVALYQMVVHTEFDWTLGPLDRVIYTPAAHRSHHATTRPESDRNLGGFFLVFDRLFGTYTPVDRHYRPPAYGLPAETQPEGLSAILFGELLAFARGIREVPGVWPKVRWAFSRP